MIYRLHTFKRYIKPIKLATRLLFFLLPTDSADLTKFSFSYFVSQFIMKRGSFVVFVAGTEKLLSGLRKNILCLKYYGRDGEI